MSTAAVVPESPWRAGLHSARMNLVPGLILQVVALALVLSYYWVPGTQAALATVTHWRSEAGVFFPMATTALFGGLLPFLYLRLNASTRNRFTWVQGFAITLWWGYKGFEIDLLYRLLARFVGEGHDVATVVTKCVLDQLVYCPILAVPLTVVAYAWVERGFNWSAVVVDMRAGGWYGRRVMPFLISNIGVWVPAVCIIYALPTPLQLPMQNLVLWFFTLLIAHLSQNQKA
jgi:hypothetical protein